MLRNIVTTDSNAVALAAVRLLIENLDRGLHQVDGLLLRHDMARDIFELLAEVSGTRSLLHRRGPNLTIH